MRDLFLRGLVVTGAAAALVTELLSPAHLLNRWTLAAFWLILAGAAIWRGARSLRFARLRGWEWGIACAIAAIAACVGLAAWVSPPNSADAMAYHLPRVVYWAQNRSVAFFPTPYFNQVMLGPMAEYLDLHSYLISDGDRFVNLLTFGAWLAAVVGVSSIAGAMGVGRLGQWLAALLCATLPDGILQGSGAKNDCLLALWLVCAVYFAVKRRPAYAGAALGLAILTKATGYLFAPPILLAASWQAVGKGSASRTAGLYSTSKMLAWVLGGVLLLNAPQYWRNWKLSGSPLGYDSAQGNGFFRWRNEHLGWRATVSNLLRNGSEQLGARSDAWNRGVYDAVLRAHAALGIDPQNLNTTWRWSRYEAPRNANHEANANNRWHLLLFAAAFAWALWRKERRWALYGAGLVCGFLLFCFYLKWQPFQARLELPLFVLAAPLGAWLLERARPRCLTLAVCLFLVSGARLPALDNWTRPLKGPESLFRAPRDFNYFRDMGQWGNRDAYFAAVDAAAKSGCDRVAIDITENQLEYPFMALLRERRPAVRFTHQPPACAVLCLDCAGNGEKMRVYGEYGEPRTIERFLWFEQRHAPR